MVSKPQIFTDKVGRREFSVQAAPTLATNGSGGLALSSTRLFTWRQFMILAGIFMGAVLVAQRTVLHACGNWFTFDCPHYWPLSIFNLRFPSKTNLLVAAVVVFAFFGFIKFLEAKRFPVTIVALVGALLIAGSTLIHGTAVGFYAPVAGDARNGPLVPFSLNGQEYYHDAMRITDPIDFLQRYNEIQPTLHQHAHTHPPGAVLVFYVLAKVFRNPALIAVVIMVTATLLTVFFFHRLMLSGASEKTAGYMAFLVALLPAVQIYYLATLDALIAGLLIGTLYLSCLGKSWKAAIGASLMLTLSFLLTFVTLFIAPVLVGFDLIVKRSLRRSLIVFAGPVLIHVLLYFAGYNALESFRIASVYENPHGFMLLVNPTNYLFTRAEDIAEILFFFGPFLTALFIRGLKQFRFSALNVLTVLGCVTLLAMFVTGAWRTGETARACAFIYPYLLLPVGLHLDGLKAGRHEHLQLATLVFAQSIVMQTFGHYHW